MHSRTHARRVTNRALAVAVAALVTLFVAGCGAAGAQHDADDTPVRTSQVSVDDDVFAPATVEVAPGTEVTWTWVGNNTHNVTADDFASDTQDSGTFTHTFDRAGTYEYACTLHPGMVGTVIVTADGGAT